MKFNFLGIFLILSSSFIFFPILTLFKSRKFPITTLLRIFGAETDESIRELFADCLDEEDTEYVTKSIEKCSSAKVLCEAAINSTSIEIIDKIGYRLSKLNETKYIYDYLLNAKGYSKEVKELLINKIIKSKDIILICLLIIYIDIKILEKVSTIFKDKIELHNFIVNSGLFNDEIILDSTKKIFVNEESIIASKEKVKILKNNKKTVKNV